MKKISDHKLVVAYLELGFCAFAFAFASIQLGKLAFNWIEAGVASLNMRKANKKK